MQAHLEEHYDFGLVTLSGRLFDHVMENSKIFGACYFWRGLERTVFSGISSTGAGVHHSSECFEIGRSFAWQMRQKNTESIAEKVWCNDFPDRENMEMGRKEKLYEVLTVEKTSPSMMMRVVHSRTCVGRKEEIACCSLNWLGINPKIFLEVCTGSS